MRGKTLCPREREDQLPGRALYACNVGDQCWNVERLYWLVFMREKLASLISYQRSSLHHSQCTLSPSLSLTPSSQPVRSIPVGLYKQRCSLLQLLSGAGLLHWLLQFLLCLKNCSCSLVTSFQVKTSKSGRSLDGSDCGGLEQ